VYTEEATYEYWIFAPELRPRGHGSDPANFRRESGYLDGEQTHYEHALRGIVGATMEYYPTKKSGNWGVVAGFRYYLSNPDQLAHVFEEDAYGGLMDMYELHAEPRKWTATVGAVIRF
jgi:hypothetical protein